MAKKKEPKAMPEAKPKTKSKPKTKVDKTKNKDQWWIDLMTKKKDEPKVKPADMPAAKKPVNKDKPKKKIDKTSKNKKTKKGS